MSLPTHLLVEAEALAAKSNTTVSAIIAQAMQAGMESLYRRERAQAAYAQLQAALAAGLTEEEQLLIDGVRLTPITADE